jgi:large subunit ribosomal protein L32e
MMSKDKDKKDKRKDAKKADEKTETKKPKKSIRKTRAKVSLIKPKKSLVRKELKSVLGVRKKVKKRKPGFKRQEGYRMVKLKKSWRRPRGRHSKLRKAEKAKGPRPSPGYGSPRSVRGLTRHGYVEVMVSSPEDLDRMDPNKDSALISSTVGRRKREDILKKALDLNIQVINE